MKTVISFNSRKCFLTMRLNYLLIIENFLNDFFFVGSDYSLKPQHPSPAGFINSDWRLTCGIVNFSKKFVCLPFSFLAW